MDGPDGVKLRPRLALVAGLVMPIGLATLVACAPGGDRDRSPDEGWVELEPGLALGAFRPSLHSPQAGDGWIRVLRVDPRRFELRLLNASAPDQGRPLSAREWCDRNGLVAAINASMYQEDLRTSVSLMRAPEHVNNAHRTKDKAILAFGPHEPGLPPVKIIDSECERFEDWEGRYGTLVQSIRMLSCRGENVWTPQTRSWSTAAIGTDDRGRVLFVHVRSRYRVHELINQLTALPLGLTRLMYGEGGPEAQLFVRSRSRDYEFVGSFEAAYDDEHDNARAWPVPNVVGVIRRTPPSD
jgi:hypothetical protein